MVEIEQMVYCPKCKHKFVAVVNVDPDEIDESFKRDDEPRRNEGYE